MRFSLGFVSVLREEVHKTEFQKEKKYKYSLELV